jgi:hypothetical protein
MSLCMGNKWLHCLGVAADLAIISASDDEQVRSAVYKKGGEPFFTQEGLKHDIAWLKNVMTKLPKKELKLVSQKVNQVLVQACNNLMHSEQCYPTEDYKNMYIKDGDGQEVKMYLSQN